MTTADILYSATITLFGVVVGFALFALWDMWKASRDAKAELHRAARSIDQELSIDLARLSTDQVLLSEDTKAADSTSEVVELLELLSTAAGETAYLKGSLGAESVELATKLRAVYSLISILNRRIENREAYRLTNGDMNNYHERRKLINQGLQQLAEQTGNRIGDFLAELKAKHLV